jgi:O-antigen/teichoic acid export membrane protein
MIAPQLSEPPGVVTATASTVAIVSVRMACQAIVLILTTRLLGVDNYGVIAALVAISLVLAPWSGLGYDFLALRAVSRDSSESSDCFWQGAKLIAITAPPIIIACIAVTSIWFNEYFRAGLVMLILIAELLCLRLTELIAKIFQGNCFYRKMAITRLMNSVARLLVLAPMAAFYSQLTALQWGWAYFIAAVLSMAFSIAFLQVHIGISAPTPKKGHLSASDGVHFAAGVMSTRLSSEFDKSLVLGLAGTAGAGIYGAGYRLISLAVAPVISFVNVVTTSMFKMHRDTERTNLSKRSLTLCGVAVVYGAAIGGLMWLFLPDVAAIVLGDDFRALSAGLLPLALLPTPIACRLVGEQAMAALGKFRIRTMAQWSIAALAVSLNLLLIPRVGWTAAAWVLLAGETSLAICYVSAIIRARRNTT